MHGHRSRPFSLVRGPDTGRPGGVGTPPEWLLSTFGRFTFSLPTDFKDTFRVWSRGAPWAPAGDASFKSPSSVTTFGRAPTPFVPSGTFPDSGRSSSPLGKARAGGPLLFGGYRSRPFSFRRGAGHRRPADLCGASGRRPPYGSAPVTPVGILRRRCGTATAAIFSTIAPVAREF